MKPSTTQNPILIHHVMRVALVTAGILLIPLIAMQFSSDVDWQLNDFVVAGTLIFVTGLLFDTIVRKVRNRNYRLALGIVLALAFMYVWAELAVGIFTNWGS